MIYVKKKLKAALVKRVGKFRYRYKKQCVADHQGLALGLVTTKASTSEIVNLEEYCCLTGVKTL